MEVSKDTMKANITQLTWEGASHAQYLKSERTCYTDSNYGHRTVNVVYVDNVEKRKQQDICLIAQCTSSRDYYLTTEICQKLIKKEDQEIT